MSKTKYALRTFVAGTLLAAAVAAAPAFAADADLGVTFATATAIKYGGVKAYKATITNIGPSHATGVAITATIPAGLKVAAVTGCTPADDTTTPITWFPCAVADIVDTYTAVVTITLGLAVPEAPTCGQTGNPYGPLTVTVSGTTTDPNAANNTASIVPVDVPVDWADLSTTFTGATTAAGGAAVVYDVTLTNDGPCAATGVVEYTDNYDATFVSTTAACLNTGDTEADGCELANVPAGTTVSYTKTYTMPTLKSDQISAYHANGVEYSADNGSAASDPFQTVVSKEFSSCSTSGSGGPTGLLALGAVLALVFRRRKA